MTKTPQSSKRSRKLRCSFRMGQTGNTSTKTSVVMFKTAYAIQDFSESMQVAPESRTHAPWIGAHSKMVAAMLPMLYPTMTDKRVKAAERKFLDTNMRRHSKMTETLLRHTVTLYGVRAIKYHFRAPSTSARVRSALCMP